MGLNADAYRDMLVQLQPPGQALPTDLDSLWVALLTIEGLELARVDARVDDLLRESDPRTAIEMVEDWERVCGLPGACSAVAQNTLAQRRAAVHAHLTARFGQRPADYEELAAALGFEITVVEHAVYTCESPCDQPIYDEPWRFVWTVRAPETTIYERTCEDGCEDPLASWGNELLECVIRQHSPAQTIVLFTYGG